MDNELKVFEAREVLGKEFRIYGTLDEPLFLAKDVAEWIEHSNTTEMLRTIDDDEKLNSTILSAGQRRECSFLTEDGLYEVLMQSRKPIAKAFKTEVKKILKTIRRHGEYQIPYQSKDILMDTEALMQIAMQLQIERERNAKLLADNRALHQKNLVLTVAKQVGYPTSELSTVREMVAIFHARGLSIRGREIFHFLRTFGYIFRDTYGYAPTERSVREGWIDVQTTVSHSKKRSTKVMITSKGIEYFFGIFKLGRLK